MNVLSSKSFHIYSTPVQRAYGLDDHCDSSNITSNCKSIYVYISVCVCVHAYVRACLSVCLCMCACMHASVCAC